MLQVNKIYSQFFFLILTTLLVSVETQAGFYFEPFLGYRQEKIKFTDLASLESEYKLSGPTYGLNLGVATATGIFLNLSGSQFKGKADTTPVQTDNPEFTHNNGAVQVGVSAMGLLKIYLGYILLNELEMKSPSPLSSFNLKGAGYQVGLALSLIPRLSLGAQYNIHQFNEISGDSFVAGKDIKNYYNKVDSQDLFAYLAYSF